MLWCCKLLDHLLLDLYVRISCCRLGSFHPIFEIVLNLFLFFFFTSHFSFRHPIDDDHVLHCITCLCSMSRVFHVSFEFILFLFLSISIHPVKRKSLILMVIYRISYREIIAKSVLCYTITSEFHINMK